MKWRFRVSFELIGYADVSQFASVILAD